VGVASLLGTGSTPKVDVLLLAVVNYGAKIEEGSLITAVAPAWKTIAAMLTKDPNVMFNIDPRKWEEIIAAAYDEAGFDEVILTPRSGDYGRDVIAVKHGHFRVRFIDQVKAYRPGHKVSANDVRAIFGVLSADPRANKGIITTTSEFAPRVEFDPLLAPFIPNRLELVDGKKLIAKLNDIAKGGGKAHPMT
jgi:restriction system protein